MQLMIAAAPELRQTACAARLPVANAAYRLEGGYLCALPMPRSLQGGALLLTDVGREAATFVQRRAALAVSLAGSDLDNGDREIMYACLEHIAGRLRDLSERGLPEK